MFESYKVLAQHGVKYGTEHQRRESALDTINEEILERRPLATFKADHLEFLEVLFAYWRELEVEAGAEEPDSAH
jgi:hypothetical protein